ERLKMLACEDLRRRHVRHLERSALAPWRPGIHDRIRARRGDQRLPASHIAFQKPCHRMRLLEISENISDRAPLRGGGRKRKRRKKFVRERLAVGDGKRSLGIVLGALHRTRDLNRENFLEREALPRSLRVTRIFRRMHEKE